MDNKKKFGPFTPQEFKSASEWLVKNNVEFTHFRDEEAEKRFSENTPENLVNQVEFRTQTYLGSVFYINANMGPELEAAFQVVTHLTPDHIPEKFKIPQIHEATHPETTHDKKAIWSRIILAALVIYFILQALKK
jgi:hypothetical protein